MKIKLYSIEQVETFITNANTTLGYPDGNCTETYCNVPELTEITENEVVTDSYYEIEITQELNEAMIKIATEKLIKTTDFKAI